MPEDYYSYGSAAVCDPWEPVNRGIFRFNEVVDKFLLRPVAVGYTKVMPRYGRERVHNVLNNMGEPVNMLNGFLQADPERGFTAMWRFILNSTFGVLGVFDFAGQNAQLTHRDEDYGQTMGVYGVGSGPYIVLPLLGPSSVRDAFGRVVDTFTDPFSYVDSNEFLIGRAAATALDTRSRSLEVTDEIYRTSLDPYATIRSAYSQHREALIRNNKPRDENIEYR